MNIRKGPTIFLVIVIVILLAAALYFNRKLIWGRNPGGRQPRQASTRAITKSPPRKKNPLDQGSAQSKQEREGMDELKNYDPKKTLSRSEYGKNNPFAAFPASRPRGRSRGIPIDKTLRDEIAEKMSPLIEFTGVLGDTAFLKVDGVEKSVSADDTVAGMKVLEVGNDFVRLSKGDKEHAITLGESFRVPTGEAN